MNPGDQPRGFDRTEPWLAFFLPACLFAAAMTVRLLHLHHLQSSPLFDIPVGDTRFHVREARAIVEGPVLGTETLFWKGPLFTYFLAGLFGLFGEDLSVARLANAMLGSANVVLVYLLGRRWTGTACGVVGGVFASLYGPFIYFDGVVLIPPLLISLLLLSLLSLDRFGDRLRPRWLVLGGVLVGLSILTRPNGVLLVPALGFWIWQVSRRHAAPAPRPLGLVALFGLAALVVVLPATVRNYVVTRDLVWISWNGGINFYIGNQPCYDQTSGQWNPDPTWDRIYNTPLKLGLDRKSAISRFYYRSALEEIGRAPLGFSWGLARKLWLFWTPHEISSNQDMYHARTRSPILGALLWKWGRFCFPFGLIGPLALIGLVRSVRGDARGRLPLYFVVAYVISIVLFFNTARYRVPVVAVLMPFAAATVVDVWGSWRRRDYRALGRRVPAAGALAAVLHLGVQDTYTLPHPEIRHLGLHCKSIGDLDCMLEAWKRDVAMHPDDPTPLYYLGLYHIRQGDFERAEAPFRKILTLGDLEPDWPALAHMKLGGIALRRGFYDRAISHYTRVIEMDPDHAYWRGKPYFQLHAGKVSSCDAEYMIAGAFKGKGDLAQALARLQRIRAECSYYPEKVALAEARIRELTRP